jgi:hypothetical protein
MLATYPVHFILLQLMMMMMIIIIITIIIIIIILSSSRLQSKNLKIRIYKTIILSVVLYGCETWSLTSREEHKLRVFEKRVLRRIFGPKRDEVTGGWRKLHNAELYNLYGSVSIN